MTDDHAETRVPVVRPVTAGDLAAVLALNNAAVPAVNGLDADEMAWFADVAHTFLVGTVGDGGPPLGFLVGLDGPGVAYDSANYRWFSARYDRFLYVDRVVVDPSASGLGMAQAFYRAFAARDDGHAVLCAEVNTRPRNDRSLAFHEAFGFEPVGSQDTEGGTKTVRMLALTLALGPATKEPV